MKKFKIMKTAVCFAAALSFIGLLASFPGVVLQAHATMITDELMEQALLEEFGSLEDSEDIDEEYYDMDIDQFTEEYLRKIESGEIQFDNLEMEHITDPPMEMTITEDGNIRYTLPNGDYFDVTAPNGIITGNVVEFFLYSDVAAVVTKDGESSSLFKSWRFSEPGKYHIQMIFYRFDADVYKSTEVYEVNYYFTITGKTAGDFGAVPAPDGFEIAAAKRDGVPINIDNPSFLFLEGDGRFEIRYRDIATNTVYTTSSFERDTIAPFLTFSKELGNGKVNGPITFSTSDISDRVYLSYNGYSAETVVYELTEAGKYGLEVVDTAGNSRLYYFEITKNSTLLDSKMIILALILLLGAGVRFLLIRRDMKVM